MKFHQPVLAAEAMEYLAVKPKEKYIDATIGGGGHTKLILEKGGLVLGIDRDPEAINYLKNSLGDNSNLTLVRANFDNLKTIAVDHGFTKVSGILFDFGTSSHQLDTPSRGFSFQYDAPLDMRMEPDLAVTAKDLVNALGRKELYALFTRFSQEKRARAIAAAIVSARSEQPITTTKQLADIVVKVYTGRKGDHFHHPGKIHPATKVFQALRIAVNDELNAIKAALPQAVEILKPTGRLVTISFHQGEDRIVKQFFKTNQHKTLITLTKKPLTPNLSEKARNPRARSAKLRAAEKI
jgi:16S rRNA (cytosine1402-N4)-methyltransferase